MKITHEKCFFVNRRYFVTIQLPQFLSYFSYKLNIYFFIINTT